MAPDILYALHHFEAENVDELSFSAGEAIVVLERDDTVASCRRVRANHAGGRRTRVSRHGAGLASMEGRFRLDPFAEKTGPDRHEP